LKNELSRAIDSYLSRHNIPFHSPAHCGTLYPRDLSELTGLDNLLYPSGILKEAQESVASFFSAERSFFLINGASVGMHAALLALKKSAGKDVDKPVLLARNVHRSVLAAIILSGLNIEWLEPEWSEDFAIYTRVAPKFCHKYLALVITNPSYEGFYSELAPIDIPIIVDEAHGAHYYFNEKLPRTALESGADIAVQSWHKTIGSLTQSGVLHVSRNSKISAEHVEAALGLLQSSSPNYILLESLMTAFTHMLGPGQEMLAGIIEKSLVFESFNDDPTRLLLRVACGDGFIPGHILAQILESEYRIAVESHSANGILALLNYANTQEDIDALHEACLSIRKQVNEVQSKSSGTQPPDFGEQVLNLRTAFNSDYEEVGLAQSIGRVCQEIYAPCPPGIALLVPGQRISRRNIAIIQYQNTYNDCPKNSIKVLKNV
jgi:arginine/lysine/ornithine decarboxylase